MLDLIKNKINSLVNYTFDSKKISQKDVTDYLNVLCWDKINELSTDEVIVNEALFVKSIEDIEIKYNDELYKIGIKINDINNKEFTMPNLISIDKVRKYLSNIKNHIIYIFIDYKIEDDMVTVMDIIVKPIECLNWSYLSIQNLGKGQLQIKGTTNTLTFNNDIMRKEWLDRLLKEGNEYYDKLILKVSEYKINWNDETKW